MRRSSCLLFASLVTLSLATEGGIRGSKSEQSETEKKFMDVEYINSVDLENLLVQVEADEKRLQSLEDVLLPGFQALPKSSERLTHHGVRYLLHRHFLESHGWLVKGLEPEGTVIGHWHVLVFFFAGHASVRMFFSQSQVTSWSPTAPVRFCVLCYKFTHWRCVCAIMEGAYKVQSEIARRAPRQIGSPFLSVDVSSNKCWGRGGLERGIIL